MKIGYIDYLNCYPFYYHMFEKEPIPGVEIVPGYPGELNRLIKEKELHMSPVSAAAYAGLQDEVLVLPGFCLSSVGYVKSVVLNSTMPIEDLDGKRVGLTSSSQTSVILLKILLEKYYAITPEYVPVGPNPSLEGIDAALVIGNEAMMESKTPVRYSYDLGDTWMRKTGYPVVFALFVVRKEAAEQYEEPVGSVINSYRLSLMELSNNKEELVAQASQRYPDIQYDIGYYYKLLKFDLTENLKEGLRFYFQEAASLGLLEPVKEIGYL
ncbi:MAG: menaquinone biosynthesis protein [bacterium]|nr:menaquinone biosynthesis protein [bacterium]